MSRNTKRTKPLLSATFEAGATIFSEGDEGDKAFIIEDGSVEIWSNVSGERITLATLDTSAIFGEMSAINGATRSANATALTDTRLTAVTSAQLRERIEDSDAVVRFLVDVLLRRYHSERRMHRGGEFEEAPAWLHALAEQAPDAIAKIKLESSLRDAVEQDALKLLYQPIVDLRTGRAVGAEALIRWHDPNLGVVPPQMFIEVAEETNLILPIDRWVVNKACSDLALLSKSASSASPEFFVNVNLSGREVLSDDILDVLDACAAENGIDSSRIKLEVTEGILVDGEGALRWMQNAVDRGYRLVLDDFGTGYSSLAYLRVLPIDTLKIDRSFIQEVVTDPGSAAIVTAVVQMARAFGVKVVAEGIESADIRAALAVIGCDLGQGYYFARPMTVLQLTELIGTP